MIDTQSTFGTYKLSPLERALLALARKAPVARGYLRKHVGQWIGRSGPVDTKVGLLDLRCYPKENSGDRALAISLARHDRFEKKAISDLASSLGRDLVFLDIGANVGLYTLAIAQAVSSAKIFAFEPLNEAASKLTFNTKQNGFENVQVLNFALGAETSQLYLDKRSETLHLQANEPNADHFIKVDVKPLSDVITQMDLEKIDALKIDVEGHEDKVLVPFFRDTARALWPQIIIIEHCSQDSWEEDCLSLLQNSGYHKTWTGKLNAIYQLDKTV